jgi:rhamnogalacturonyl hydrolase YesR
MTARILIILALLAALSNLAPTQSMGQTTAPSGATAGRAGRGPRQNDTQRHFGDAPDVALPIATDISADLKPDAVSAAMKKVADWQLAVAQPYFNYEWTFGPLYSGLLVTSQVTGDPKYHDAMVAFGNSVGWQLNPAAQVTTANDHCMGQAYVDLYLQHHDTKMLYPTELDLDDAILGADFFNRNNPPGGFGGVGGFGGAGAGRNGRGATTAPANADFSNNSTNPDNIEWWWSDALYMSPATWMRVYEATNNPKYLNYANWQWWITSDHLYDKTNHLYFRDNSFKTKKEANGQPMFWSRGDGWVMGAFPRVIPLIPDDFKDKQKYIDQFKEMAARFVQIQGPDGLWRAGLLDPDSYDLPENSGSALTCYALAWGINAGILDSATYRPAVAKCWAGLISHVYQDGRLGCIQQTGSAPAKFKATSSYVYGVGAYLLAGSEIYKMSQAQ